MKAVLRQLLPVLFFVFATIHDAGASPADWMDPGPAIPDVTLRDQDGHDQRLAAILKDRTVIINFFFTGCSATCPTQTLAVDKVREQLSQKSTTNAPPLFLSISLDPLGDTPEAMRDFAGRMGVTVGEPSHWLMLTGGVAELESVWQAFDQISGTPADHGGFIWIGQMQNSRWTRVSSQAPADGIVSRAMEPKS